MNSALFFEGNELSFINYLKQQAYSSWFILSDARTNGFCVPVLNALMPEFHQANRIVIPQGEANKTLDSCSLIWQQLTEKYADTSSVLINVGGGTLSDIGGFAASVYKRGISYINIPTTLLAQADACYGGKTGIDWQGIKNHIGSFQYPASIYINNTFLRTLDERTIRSGWAEIIKHALISSPLWWSAMQQYQPHDFTLMPVIEQSIHAKHNLVEGDLNDKGMRQMLNFGHSIGHAIESASMQSDFPLLHGEAVMLGMYFESLLSEKIFELTSDISKTLRRVIEMHFAHLNFDYSFTQLSPFLQHDKKNNGDIRMSLLKRVGQGQIQTIVHTALLDEIMPST